MKKLLFLSAILISAFTCRADQPVYYVHQGWADPQNAYYFDVINSTESVTKLSTKTFALFCIPTLDAVAGETGTTNEGDRIFYEVTLFGKDGETIRSFKNVVPFSMIHHPEKKIIYFFTGSHKSEVVTGTDINSYDYENDIITTLEINPVSTITFQANLAFNPNDGFIYFGDDLGSVYKVDGTDFSSGILETTSGIHFSTNGTYSATIDHEQIVIYKGNKLITTLSRIYNYIEYYIPIFNLYWYDDSNLIFNIGGYYLSYNIEEDLYYKIPNLPSTPAYITDTSSFYRLGANNNLINTPAVELLQDGILLLEENGRE